MTKGFSFEEFKPTILFLGWFVGLYLIGNLLYGFYVTSFKPGPDPVTRLVTENSALVLNVCGWSVNTSGYQGKSTTVIWHEGKAILSVYEGCNGINTMIIFVAFLFAFGPVNKKLVWFIPLGIVVIYLMNLLRITLLFFIAQYFPEAMYFIHKYVFTGMLYLVIFALWLLWVKKISVPVK
jgi:exosortase family protein XrtF